MNTYAITTSQGVLSAMVDTPDDFVNIDSKIVALKLAAIDAYMYYYSWERKGDHYEPSMTNITEMPTIFDALDHPPRVTRPGPNGEGGGDWSCSNWAIGMIKAMVKRSIKFELGLTTQLRHGSQVSQYIGLYKRKPIQVGRLYLRYLPEVSSIKKSSIRGERTETPRKLPPQRRQGLSRHLTE